jgi:hypothetical protein
VKAPNAKTPAGFPWAHVLMMQIYSHADEVSVKNRSGEQLMEQSCPIAVWSGPGTASTGWAVSGHSLHLRGSNHSVTIAAIHRPKGNTTMLRLAPRAAMRRLRPLKSRVTGIDVT